MFCPFFAIINYKGEMHMDKEIIRFPENNDVVFTEYGIPTEFPSHWHNAAEFTVILKKDAYIESAIPTMNPLREIYCLYGPENFMR